MQHCLLVYDTYGQRVAYLKRDQLAAAVRLRKGKPMPQEAADKLADKVANPELLTTLPLQKSWYWGGIDRTFIEL